MTVAPATITNQAGKSFKAHGDYISGRNLLLDPVRLIVQTSAVPLGGFSRRLHLYKKFEQNGIDTILIMVYAFCPQEDAANINKGLTDFYLDPWKKHLNNENVLRKNNVNLNVISSLSED
ncbi:MAG: hypothetical protein H0W62_02145 [Chitinophagales bacterium]|nr:hypothetical protein [Chitinophagales bacterium]